MYLSVLSVQIYEENSFSLYLLDAVMIDWKLAL